MPALTQAARDYENALIQNRQLQAAAEAARLEKVRADVQKSQEETFAGRVALGERLAMIQERDRQAREGVAIGADVAERVLAPSSKGGIGLLEGTKMQSEMELQNRMERGRLGAIQQYGIEKGILPTAKVDVGGITATVPFQSAGEKMSQAYRQQYQGMVPVVAEKYMAEGYDRDSAIRKASEDVGNTLIKKNFNGDIPIYAIDGQTVMQFLPQKEAIKMFQDPKTPKFIANQLEQYFGPKGQSAAQDWVKSRIGR